MSLIKSFDVLLIYTLT